MKYLYLIRHAKSSWSDPRLSDFDRPLNKRGKRDLPVMGQRMATYEPKPELIISSPAKRARRTARGIGTALGFSKREMVVTVEDGKYPQDINLEFVQDKAALLDSLQPGQEVTVSFDIRGREYNGRYFNNLQGWRVVSAVDEAVPPAEEQHFPTPSDFGDDDIPF